MAAFCHFYHYTPTQYRALWWKDFNALATYMHEEIKRQNENS